MAELEIGDLLAQPSVDVQELLNQHNSYHNAMDADPASGTTLEAVRGVQAQLNGLVDRLGVDGTADLFHLAAEAIVVALWRIKRKEELAAYLAVLRVDLEGIARGSELAALRLLGGGR